MMLWNRKSIWFSLLILMLALGVAWIAFSRVPTEAAAARNERPPSPQVNFAAPDFSLETLEGDTIKLADLRGQALLINFWATWCPPCRAEMPAIQQVYERYRDQGFTVLAVDLQEGNAEVAAFTEQMGLTFPILMDRDGQVFSRYRVKALPSTYFVDREGIIREVTIGGPMTEAFIESQVTKLLETGEEN
jgi:peroxiredoxin